MKLRTIGLSLLALLLVGCGKDNKVTNVPNQNQNTDAFTTGVLANNGTPKTKDSISFNQKKFFTSTRNTKCSYIIDTSVVVLRANGNNLRLKINNKSTSGRRNSTYCPYTYPNMRNVRYANITMNQFIAETKTKLNKALNPNVFCSENRTWCNSARLIEKKDVTKYGIPSVYVEAEYSSKNGNFYNRKTYISKVSLLQNAYEYNMVNIRTGEKVAFKRLKPSSRRRNPRR